MEFWHADYADCFCICGICEICVAYIWSFGTQTPQNTQIFFAQRAQRPHPLQGPCLVPTLKRPTPNPSLRREGNNYPRREYGYPKKVSDDVHPLYTHNVHPLAGAVPRRRTVARSAQYGPIYTQATAHSVLRASSSRLVPSTAVTIPRAALRLPRVRERPPLRGCCGCKGSPPYSPRNTLSA